MSRIINTDRELYALKAEPARYERAVSKARGLSVLVFPNGCKTFVVRYKSPSGKRRRISLGDYPAVTLADARLRATALRLDVAAGKDPFAEGAVAKLRARAGERVSDLADGYWKAAAIGIHGGRRRPLKTATLDRQRALWLRYVQPALGERRFADIRRADVRAFMQGFVLAGRLSPATIASIGDVVRALFAYGLHEDLVEANPTVGLTRPITPQSRSRLFSNDAMSWILLSLADASRAVEGRDDPHARMCPNMALVLRFLILTLTRRVESASARWPEVDEAAATWTIPGARTKNGKIHVVPLSPEAMAVLEEARKLPGYSPEGFIFPSLNNPDAPIDGHALTRAINRLCVRLDLPIGSPHDFRRTGATLLTGERHGVRRFIVGKVLGHTAQEGPAVTSVYDRNEYLAEKRAALESWGRHVIELTVPPAGRPAAPSEPPSASEVGPEPAQSERPTADIIDLFSARARPR